MESNSIGLLILKSISPTGVDPKAHLAETLARPGGNEINELGRLFATWGKDTPPIVRVARAYSFLCFLETYYQLPTNSFAKRLTSNLMAKLNPSAMLAVHVHTLGFMLMRASFDLANFLKESSEVENGETLSPIEIRDAMLAYSFALFELTKMEYFTSEVNHRVLLGMLDSLNAGFNDPLGLPHSEFEVMHWSGDLMRTDPCLEISRQMFNRHGMRESKRIDLSAMRLTHAAHNQIKLASALRGLAQSSGF